MRLYHGATSPNALAKCREAAPNHSHGFCWNPTKMTPHDDPYILDNGAFRAFARGEPWDVDNFVRRLGEIETRMPRGPDFVVLPDVIADPEQTVDRARKWAPMIDHPTALPCQDGMGPERAVEVADETGAEALFVGGTERWKRAHAADFVAAAHDHGLRCHIGRPNVDRLKWALEIGADSVDTTSVSRNQAYHKLVKMEEQTTLQPIADGGRHE